MEKIRELFKKYREQIAYIFYGALTTAVDFVTYFLIADVLFASVGYIHTPAQSVSWLVSVIFAFFTNKFRVFKSTEKTNIGREFLTFFGARALSGIFQIGGFALFVNVLGLASWDMVIKLALSVVVVIINYVLSKFLIFKK